MKNIRIWFSLLLNKWEHKFDKPEKVIDESSKYILHYKFSLIYRITSQLNKKLTPNG